MCVVIITEKDILEIWITVEITNIYKNIGFESLYFKLKNKTIK